MDVVIDECAWHHVHNVGVICVPCWCVKVLHVAVWGTRPYKNVMSEAPIAMCWQCVNIAGYKARKRPGVKV